MLTGSRNGKIQVLRFQKINQEYQYFVYKLIIKEKIYLKNVYGLQLTKESKLLCFLYYFLRWTLSE